MNIAKGECVFWGFVLLLKDCRYEGIEDERAFSGTGYTDDGAEAIQWDFQIYIFQVSAVCALESQPVLFWVLGIDCSSVGRKLFCEEVFRGEAVTFLEFAGSAAEADLSAMCAGLWSDFDDLVGLL